MARRAMDRSEAYDVGDGDLPGCARLLDTEVEAYEDGYPSNATIERKVPKSERRGARG